MSLNDVTGTFYSNGSATAPGTNTGFFAPAQVTMLDGSVYLMTDSTPNAEVWKPVCHPRSAFNMGALTNQTVAAGSTATVTFAASGFDVGSNFSSNTTFTAPRGGAYLFTTTLTLNIASTQTSTTTLKIVTTGQTFQTIFTNAPYAGATKDVTLSVMQQMTAGDTAFVQLINGSANGSTVIQGSSTFPSSFSGHIVCLI